MSKYQVGQILKDKDEDIKFEILMVAPPNSFDEITYFVKEDGIFQPDKKYTTYTSIMEDYFDLYCEVLT